MLYDGSWTGPLRSQSAVVSPAVAHVLTPASAAKCRWRVLVVEGAVKRHVESAEKCGSLARVVDSQS